MNAPLIGQGKTAKVYREGDRAIKLYTGASLEAVRAEAERHTFAFEAGLPVPRVYGVKELDCGVALEMQYVEAEVLVRPQMHKEERRALFEELVYLQDEVHTVEAAGQPLLSEKLAWKIEHAPHLDQAVVGSLIRRLSDLERGKTCLCHGDFHPLNVLKGEGKLWIIDWMDAACGDPLADLCRSYLILRQYAARMSGVYLKMCSKRKGIHPEAVVAWLPVVAAARLRENLNDSETAFLLELIRGSLR